MTSARGSKEQGAVPEPGEETLLHCPVPPSCNGIGEGDNLPILPGTQLGLELAFLRDPPDLGELAEILRGDPVAVLRLLAAAGAEPAPGDIPVRLEDAIAVLSREELVDAFCRPLPAHGREAKAALAFAQQARAVGQMCRALAETFGLCAEDAYVVGLLHRIGALQGQLGRADRQQDAPARESACLAICRRYSLAGHLLRALEEVEHGAFASPWAAMVHAADELLATSAQDISPCEPAAAARTEAGSENLLREQDVKSGHRLPAPPQSGPDAASNAAIFSGFSGPWIA
jgi:hypothetical protein